MICRVTNEWAYLQLEHKRKHHQELFDNVGVDFLVRRYMFRAIPFDEESGWKPKANLSEMNDRVPVVGHWLRMMFVPILKLSGELGQVVDLDVATLLEPLSEKCK